jgi:hypothetical protein
VSSYLGFRPTAKMPDIANIKSAIDNVNHDYIPPPKNQPPMVNCRQVLDRASCNLLVMLNVVSKKQTKIHIHVIWQPLIDVMLESLNTPEILILNDVHCAHFRKRESCPS